MEILPIWAVCVSQVLWVAIVLFAFKQGQVYETKQRIKRIQGQVYEIEQRIKRITEAGVTLVERKPNE